ncbi:MAG TPA: hypothetical protein VMS65_01395 [Polyangiaceae bacterium]|nr:hypothetical protein [Polyangiaceae bacterium]
MTLSGALLAASGCGGVDDDGSGISDPDSAATNDNSATSDSALSARQRRIAARLRASAAATAATETATTTPATSGTGAGNTSSAALDPDAVAAAARTPDGAAVPQPAGPNGQCPDVLAVFGFWSCPNVNERCSLTSGGTTTSCTCTRTDGEGQFPSWVCAQ